MKKENVINLNFKLSQENDIPEIIQLIRNNFRPEVFEKLIYSCNGINLFIKDNLAKEDFSTKYISVFTDITLIAFLEYSICGDNLHLNYIVIKKEYQGKGLATPILLNSLNSEPIKSPMLLKS